MNGRVESTMMGFHYGERGTILNPTPNQTGHITAYDVKLDSGENVSLSTDNMKPVDDE